MTKQTIYGVESKYLMNEYKQALEELMKKDCYVTGLRQAIEEQVQDYYNQFRGNWYKLHIDGISDDDTDVRIGNIEVEFNSNMLTVRMYLVLDPHALSDNIAFTDKEKRIISKAKKLWEKDKNYNTVYDYDCFLELSDKLEMMDSYTELVSVKYYHFTDSHILGDWDICTGNLVLGTNSTGAKVRLNMAEQRNII